MNHLCRSFFVLLLVVFAGCSGLTVTQKQLVGKEAPVTKYILLDRTQHTIKEKQGSAVVLAFWDARCSHCKKVMPRVSEIADAFVGSEKVFFLALSVNSRDEEEDVRDAISYLKLSSMSHAFSGKDILDEAFRAYDGDTVPLLVLIDQRGFIRWIGDSPGDLRAELFEAGVF